VLKRDINGSKVPFAAGQGVKYPAGKQMFVTGNNVDIGDRSFVTDSFMLKL
jgi:hypothetical protein